MVAVNRLLQAYRDERRIENAPHESRRRATSAEEDRILVAAVVDDRFRTATDIRQALGLNVPLNRIDHRLREYGLKS